MKYLHDRDTPCTRGEQDVGCRQTSQRNTLAIHFRVDISGNISEVSAQVPGISHFLGYFEIMRREPERGTDRGPVLREHRLQIHCIEYLYGTVHGRHPAYGFAIGLCFIAFEIVVSHHPGQFFCRA